MTHFIRNLSWFCKCGRTWNLRSTSTGESYQIEVSLIMAELANHAVECQMLNKKEVAHEQR